MKHSVCLSENLKFPPNIQYQLKVPVMKGMKGPLVCRTPESPHASPLEAESPAGNCPDASRTWQSDRLWSDRWVLWKLLGRCPVCSCCSLAFAALPEHFKSYPGVSSQHSERRPARSCPAAAHHAQLLLSLCRQLFSAGVQPRGTVGQWGLLSRLRVRCKDRNLITGDDLVISRPWCQGGHGS